jgi:outer membrane protein assembly factor BamB
MSANREPLKVATVLIALLLSTAYTWPSSPATVHTRTVTAIQQRANTVTGSDPSVALQIDPSHAGNQPSDSLAPPLNKQWDLDLQGPVSYPLIANGCAYVIVNGGAGGGPRIYALDLATGATLWGPIDLGGDPTAAAYDGGRIFTVNQSGVMQALDAATGQILWITPLPDEWSFDAPPTALNGLVYVQGGGTGAEVYAVNEADGTVKWGYSDTHLDLGTGALVVTNTAVYVAAPFQDVYAFNSQTGAPLWVDLHPGSGIGGSTASLYQNKLYARYTAQEGGNLILDANTGAELGTFSADAPPAFSGNQGFFRSGTTLTAVDLTTNAVDWQFSGDGQLNSAPVVANGFVYIGSAGGNVYALPLATGSPVTTLTAGEPVTAFADGISVADLAIGDRTLLVPAGTHLVAFADGAPATSPSPVPPPSASLEAPTGGLSQAVGLQIDTSHSGLQQADSEVPPLPKAWVRDLPVVGSGVSASSPIVADGDAFVVLENHVYALNLQTGADAWSPILTNPYSTIAYADHRLFIEDLYGLLTAVNSTTGAVLWSVTLPIEIARAPTVFGGIVYVGAYQFAGKLYAVSAQTGEVLWSVADGIDAAGAPAVSSTGVYAVLACGETHAFNPLTGAPLWSKPGSCSSGGGGSTSSLFGGRLYIHDTFIGRHFVTDAATGNNIRLYPSSALPAFDGSLGFFLAGTTLQAEDLLSGTIRWAFTGDGGLVTSPIVVNGYVYVGSSSGVFYAVSALSGQQVWSDNTGAAFLGGTSYGATGNAAGEGMVIAVAGSRLVAYGSHAAVITGISPNVGPLVGGTTVTIAGARFTGATAVYFGAAAASIVSITDTEITVITPPMTASGPVDVTVTVPSGTSVITSADANRFTYVDLATTTTTTAVASSSNPSTVGGSVTYTATVSPTPNGGTVKFTDNAITLAGCGAVAVNTSTGKAACTTSYGAAGSHAIVASYSGDTNFAASSGSLTQQVITATAVAVLPAMANGAYGGYVTAATIQNTGTAPAAIRIDYYDQNGSPVGAGDSMANLPVNGSWTVRQDNGNSFPSSGGDAAQAGSAVVYSSQPVASFVNEFAPGNVGDATSYSGIQVPSGVGATLYAPTIVNNAYGGYTTGIGLLNQGNSPTNVSITYRDGSGAVLKTQTVSGLAAHAYHALYSGDTTLALPSGFAGTATITSSAGQPLGAVVNEVGPGGQFSSYDAVPSGSALLNVPAALNNAFGGYYTGMGIQNTSASSGTVTVTYYDAAGASTVKSFTIPGNGSLGVYQGSATDGPAVGAYTATITSTLPLAAIVNEVAPSTTSAKQSTSYNAFASGSPTLNLPLVENAGSDPWNTGEGIMNTGTGSTTVTVTYYNTATGAAVSTPQTLTLAPHAFWGLYQPTGGLSSGTRATAVITTSSGGQVAAICNESSSTTFMSYDGQ